MDNELRGLIKAQKYFYRDNYRRGCTVLAVMLAVILGLILAILYVYIENPPPNFYATSSDGKLVLLTPRDTPNYSDTPLIQ